MKLPNGPCESVGNAFVCNTILTNWRDRNAAHAHTHLEIHLVVCREVLPAKQNGLHIPLAVRYVESRHKLPVNTLTESDISTQHTPAPDVRHACTRHPPRAQGSLRIQGENNNTVHSTQHAAETANRLGVTGFREEHVADAAKPAGGLHNSSTTATPRPDNDLQGQVRCDQKRIRRARNWPSAQPRTGLQGRRQQRRSRTSDQRKAQMYKLQRGHWLDFTKSILALVI